MTAQSRADLGCSLQVDPRPYCPPCCSGVIDCFFHHIGTKRRLGAFDNGETHTTDANRITVGYVLEYHLGLNRYSGTIPAWLESTDGAYFFY